MGCTRAGSRQPPCPPSGLAGGAGGAQGARSAALLKDCQQAVVVLFAAPPGYAPRCFAASARDPRHRPPKNRYDEMVPAGGRLYRLPTPGTREEPAQRAAAAAAAAAGGSRSAARPDAGHEDPPTTAPRAPTACLAHTHRLARLLPGAGRSTFSPPIVSWPSPPQRERGSGLSRTALAIKQLTIAGGPTPALAQARKASPTASNETPGRPPRRPPPPTAHQPHHDRQYRHPWQPNTPSQGTHYANSLRPISTPSLGPAGGKDTAAINRKFTAPQRHTEPCRQTQLLGAGEDDRVRSCCVHLEDNPSEAPMLCGR